MLDMNVCGSTSGERHQVQRRVNEKEAEFAHRERETVPPMGQNRQFQHYHQLGSMRGRRRGMNDGLAE